MKPLLKVITLALTTKWVSCTIDGISFMDPLKSRPLPNTWPKGEDPCNPLYWYPRNIPEYCEFIKATPKPVEVKPVPALPMPIPVPIPVLPNLPVPPTLPIPPTLPMPPIPMPMPPMPMPYPPQFMPMPGPFPIMPPIPYGIPIQPSNPMIPVGGISVPYPGYPPAQPSFLPPYGFESQVGMVPGISGLVSPDGGINVLPFSDVYSELLEKHKQKMVRKKMEKLIAKYDHPRRGYRRHRKSYRRVMDLDSREDDYMQ